ncbi:MAG TPA: TrkA family potassium uptake protein [Candidatus Melainabacteria bacterium]|nr:TrkA family potassium uptake protein [Candidatus Melainabacteria bacterium]HMP50623.1 TrkA family potassium uptake protein [Candidatus Melainabacteria bacterium]
MKRKSEFKKSLRLIKVLLREFRVFLLTVTVAFFGSTTILYFVYPLAELPPHHHSFLGVAYDTLLLTFFEQPIPFVDDLRLIPVFFGLPILGLLVIVDGAVRLGNLVVQYRKFSQEWQKLVAASYQNHVIICGLGNVGKRVAEQLLKFEEEIVCIENREDSKFIAEMTRLRVPVLVADATRASVLEEANIKQAKALMALTDKDLNNLETALTARELNPEVRIVMRMFDQSLADKVKNSLGIECVYSASALAAPVFAQSVVSENLLSSFQFGSTLVNAYQMIIKADSKFAGMKIDDVRKEYEITVLMHDRQGSVDWNPPTEIILSEGDKLLIVTEADGVKDLLALEKLT